MAIKVPQASIVPRTYAELLRSVMAVLVAGRQQVEVAWVRTYHETGRLIFVHELHKKERAEYGAKIYPQLSADVGLSVRTLQECVKFYRSFPIARALAQLGWNRCRLLCQVTDPIQRTALVAETKKYQWKTPELETRVRALNGAMELVAADSSPANDEYATKRAVRILKPRRGTPGLYRVVARGGELAVDAGFKFYAALDQLPGQLPRGLKAGDIVDLADGDFTLRPDATAANLFTYRVSVRRALDGDTLAVTIFLPHGEMDEKLRLRGLDCPETDTPEGKAAKRFTEALLFNATEVIITTSKVDKYDRYLADVHIHRADGDLLFLNNALLENGHAVPMGAEEMTDWVP